jgi:transposase-like protein
MSILSKKYFHSEKHAFTHMETILWADGVVCPHCKALDQAGKLEGVKDTKGRQRLGLWKCYVCRKQFTVTVGTVFESRHIPLCKMLQALYLLSASKKGCSAHQLHRTLGVTYKTAWFLAHRIREAMRDGSLAPMGGAGKIVEADETYFGKTEIKRSKGKGGPANKRAVLSLVERGGSVRSFHFDQMNQANVSYIVRTNVARESRLHTDESRLYFRVGPEFDGGHHRVRHSSSEYVRYSKDGGPAVHTNTIEGYFSIFKRGMKGIYQHCSEKHLHRYLAEYDFRYNNRVALGVNDEARATRALKGVVGKRLKYRNPNEIAVGG